MAYKPRTRRQMALTESLMKRKREASKVKDIGWRQECKCRYLEAKEAGNGSTEQDQGDNRVELVLMVVVELCMKGNWNLEKVEVEFHTEGNHQNQVAVGEFGMDMDTLCNL